MIARSLHAGLQFLLAVVLAFMQLMSVFDADGVRFGWLVGMVCLTCTIFFGAFTTFRLAMRLVDGAPPGVGGGFLAVVTMVATAPLILVAQGLGLGESNDVVDDPKVNGWWCAAAEAVATGAYLFLEATDRISPWSVSLLVPLSVAGVVLSALAARMEARL